MSKSRPRSTKQEDKIVIDSFQILLNNQAIATEERNFLFVLLKEGTNKCIEFFLLTKHDDPWQGIKDFLLDSGENKLREDRLKIAKSAVARAEKLGETVSALRSGITYISDYLLEESSSEDQDYSVSHSDNSQVSETITNTEKAATRQNYPISDKPIRGELITYAKGTMGGFNVTTLNLSGKRDGKLYVSSNSVITRPDKVTGNLGSEAGDHLISFSLFTKYIESLVKGKEVYDAIEALAVKVAGFHEPTDNERGEDSYQGIIEKAKLFKRSTNPYDQIEAFEFLKSEFIPHVIARWNQQDLTAFKSRKTAKERGYEGKDVKRAIKKDPSTIVDYSNEEEINNFISAIDYKPIEASREDVRPNSIRSMLGPGERSNDVNVLSRVIGKIIETYSSLYDIDAQHNSGLTDKIIEKMLERHGWLDYYCKHRDESQSEDSSVQTRHQIRETIKNQLTENIKEYISQSNPHLGDTASIDDSSQGTAGNDLGYSSSSSSELVNRMTKRKLSEVSTQTNNRAVKKPKNSSSYEANSFSTSNLRQNQQRSIHGK